ncbi:hypothetical protein B0O99DRAFT_736147 [Bisporella sp. PMI_857]|nr:hypothetical protein B0O99DRAFT_736147 [Bisporella sp. PMI_857]
MVPVDRLSEVLKEVFSALLETIDGAKSIFGTGVLGVNMPESRFEVSLTAVINSRYRPEATAIDPYTIRKIDARQRILTCLQHGMRSGMGFILPTIKIQTDDIELLPGDGENASLDQYFDQELFVYRLKRSCPRLAIYNNEDSAVNLGISLNWNSAPGFGASLRSLLTWPGSVYNLAFSALYTLSTQYQLCVSHSDTSNSPHYLGVHLHTFGNASRPKSSSYEEQIEHYMNLASSSSYPVIYVASDDEVSISRFPEDFSKKTGILGNKMIVTKQDLLKGAHRQELNNLTWYQATMVDHIILQSAGYFSGLVESTFSWNAASDRRAARSGGATSCGSQEENDTPGIVWQDEWSQIWSVH